MQSRTDSNRSYWIRRIAIGAFFFVLFFSAPFWWIFGPAIRHSVENPVTTVESRKDIDALPKHVDRLAAPTLNDSDLEYLADHVAVRELDLGDNTTFTDDGLRHVALIKGLESISLDRTNVTDKGVRHLRRLPLTYINLWHTRIGDKSLDYIAEMEPMQQLQIKGCRRVTDKGVAKLKPLRNLWMVNLSQCTQITDTSICTLSDMPSINFIQVFDCPNVSQRAVDDFLDAQPDRRVDR